MVITYGPLSTPIDVLADSPNGITCRLEASCYRLTAPQFFTISTRTTNRCKAPVWWEAFVVGRTALTCSLPHGLQRDPKNQEDQNDNHCTCSHDTEQ